jgi:hypothetical protein
MKTNMGTADRVIRIVIAIAASVLYFTETLTGTLGYIALAVGGIFLLTSIVGFCPLYRIVGISTCKVKS